MPSRKHQSRRGRRPSHRRSLPVDAAVLTAVGCSSMRMIACNGETCVESIVATFEELKAAQKHWPVIWIDIEGLQNRALIEMIGHAFDISALALEDAVTPDERPKVEVFGHQVLVAARMARFEGDAILTDPVGIFLGDRYILTFRERLAHDGFGAVRDHLRNGRTQIGRTGADALCALLLDTVIDSYFPVLEQFGDRLETLEDEAIDHPTRDSLARIHDVRTDLMTLRRALWPTRDLLHVLGRELTPLISDQSRAHFRDCYDHTMELLDLMESYREIGSDLRDIYLASLNNRMNDVMKVLAVIATIFMPLTFITGYFGMNFDTASPWNMPLLGYRYGAVVATVLMIATTLGMVIFFWRRGWLKRWH